MIKSRLRKILSYAITTAALMFVVSVASFAATDFSFMNGYRANGMGGAFTAVADDENAFFYNPAGITQRTDFLLQVVSFDSKIQDFGFFTNQFGNMSNFDGLSPSEQESILSSLPRINLSLPNTAFITRPIPIGNNYLSFGMGFFSGIDLNLAFERQSSSDIFLNMDVNGTLVYAIPIAYEITNLDAIRMPGKLSVGTNLKYISRYKVHQFINTSEFSNSTITQDLSAGDGFGADLGLLYSFTKELSFGLQLKDFFGTTINYASGYQSVSTSSTGASVTQRIALYKETLDPSLSIGVSYVPEKIFNIDTKNRFTFAFDLQDIGGAGYPGGNFMDNVHAGVEYRLSPFALRLGLNSGRIAAGIGLETNGFQLAYSYYGEPSPYSTETAWVNQFTLAFKIGHQKGRPFGKAVDAANRAAASAPAQTNQPAPQENQTETQQTAEPAAATK